MKSYYSERYLHNCPTCALEHGQVPTLWAKPNGQPDRSATEPTCLEALFPWELVGEADGVTQVDVEGWRVRAQAQVHFLFWNLPRSSGARDVDLLVMN